MFILWPCKGLGHCHISFLLWRLEFSQPHWSFPEVLTNNLWWALDVNLGILGSNSSSLWDFLGQHLLYSGPSELNVVAVVLLRILTVTQVWDYGHNLAQCFKSFNNMHFDKEQNMRREWYCSRMLLINTSRNVGLHKGAQRHSRKLCG